jgi:hypothetical protein
MYKQAELIFNPEQKHIQYSKQSEYGNAEWAHWRQDFNNNDNDNNNNDNSSSGNNNNKIKTILMHLSLTIW